MTSNLKTLGFVAWSSRRHVMIFDSDWKLIKGTLKTKSLLASPGDIVEYTVQDENCHVQNILPRRNLLRRTADNKTKELAANLDHVFLVTAPPPLFNTSFVDRVLAACEAEEIPCTLVLNKYDLATAQSEELTNFYQKRGYRVLFTNAITGLGIADLRRLLIDNKATTTLLTGISGVGKSSLVRCLVPDSELQVGAISEKIGQGRHTTTQPQAYHVMAQPDLHLVMIDIPGILRFGVEHLSQSQLMRAFPEIWECVVACKFKGCTHKEELGCVVLKKLLAGEILPSRYESYRAMLEEVSKRYY